MLIIGLTGGVATGKSTVASMLAELGARVVDADVIARQVVEPGKPAWRGLLENYGIHILQDDGTLNRRALGRLVFGNLEELARLNQITHPHILEAIHEQMEALRREGAPVVVLDVPLLFETGLDKQVDAVWVVTATREQQLERLEHRDDLSPDEAEMRLAAQMPLEEKARRAQVVIDNAGTIEDTRRQVLEAWLRHSDNAAAGGAR